MKATAPVESFATVGTVARLCAEALSRLDKYGERVSGGEDLQAALDFAQFVLWSGITILGREYQRDVPKIDPAHLTWRAEELQREVRLKMKGGIDATYKATVLERIDQKLSLIAGRLSQS